MIFDAQNDLECQNHAQHGSNLKTLLINHNLLWSITIMQKIKNIAIMVPEIWAKGQKFDLLTLRHPQIRVLGILTYGSF